MEQFLPLSIIGGLWYVLLFLPQQRRNNEHKRLLASLEVGDEVVLNSGIHGFIAELEAQVLWLEVAEKGELKVSRSAVAGKVDGGSEDSTDDAGDTAEKVEDD